MPRAWKLSRIEKKLPWFSKSQVFQDEWEYNLKSWDVACFFPRQLEEILISEGATVWLWQLTPHKVGFNKDIWPPPLQLEMTTTNDDFEVFCLYWAQRLAHGSVQKPWKVLCQKLLNLRHQLLPQQILKTRRLDLVSQSKTETPFQPEIVLVAIINWCQTEWQDLNGNPVRNAAHRCGVRGREESMLTHVAIDKVQKSMGINFPWLALSGTQSRQLGHQEKQWFHAHLLLVPGEFRFMCSHVQVMRNASWICLLLPAVMYIEIHQQLALLRFGKNIQGM